MSFLFGLYFVFVIPGFIFLLHLMLQDKCFDFR